MKKILITLSLAIVLALSGCQSQGKNNKAKEELNQEDLMPITVKDIPYKIDILESDNIGNVYMDAVYTNNSLYPITKLYMEVLLLDKNEKTYLIAYDKVMPGETSPKFKSRGPLTQNKEDYEILKIEITAKKSDNQEMIIKYDNKLDQYEDVIYSES